MTIFDTTKNDATKETCFFGNPVNIARYDKMRYPVFDKLTDKQLGFFWRPEEVNLSPDSKDFKALTPSLAHIFTSNLKRQIVLDSVQGRAPVLALGPLVSIPELETWIQTWTFNETIHSKSYTHIIRNIYSDPSAVFDEMLDIQEILDCATDISKYYDELIALNNYHAVHGYKYNELYAHKKALWLCINAINALEGVRFFVSFACSWAFAEVKLMEGNAKIIKLISRDENVHLASTQHMLKILPNEDPDFAAIKAECYDDVIGIFNDVVNQEKAWAKYLFKGGSMIGLNEELLCSYVDWTAHKRLTSLGVTGLPSAGANPLPWTQKWISGGDVQVAPQEAEISSYIIGGVKKDLTDETFTGFTL
jgi:ribonucleoside-diphosphate reductase beta chain